MPAFGVPSSPSFGASSSSFDDEVYLRYVINVLVLPPTPAVSPTRFPFSFGSTPAFSQSTPAFGSSPFGTVTSAFGAQSSPFELYKHAGGQAITPAFGSVGFGQTSFDGQHLGSRVNPYAQTPEADHRSSTQTGKLVSISAMPAHKEKSHEEFRWEDYQLGDKGGPNPACRFSGGMNFNTNNTQSNPFSSSPAFNHLSANPTFNTPGFGSSTPSLGSLPFGASAYNPSGPTPPPTPSVFDASSTPVFGASSTPVFGASSTPAFGSSPSPALGSTSSSTFSFGSIPAFSQSTTPGFGSGGFGQTSFGGQHGGSRVTPYAQTPEADVGSTLPAGELASISAMPAYKKKSHEELRWEDYQLGDEGGPNAAGQSSGVMNFNTNNTLSNPFSSSPAFNHLSANPTLNTPGFGSSTPSLGSLPFGASAYNPSGSTPPPTPSVFGASSTPAFGASSTPAFGASSTPVFGASSTPAFGSSPSPALGSTSSPTFSFGSIPAFSQSTTPGFGSGGFGQTSFGGQHGGSRVTPYAQTPEADVGSTRPAGELASISAMPAYKKKSHEELRWEDYQLGDEGGPNAAGQSSGGMAFNTNTTQSTCFSFPPAFSQLSANPFSSSTSSNPFAQKTPAFSTSGFGSSTPSVFGSTPGFAATTSASFSGTPSSSPFGTSTSIFGTTQAQGATPSFSTGLNFSNTQSSPLFQSSTPSLGQTSSPFGQASSVFGQAIPSSGQTDSAFGQAAPSFAQTASAFGQAAPSFGQSNPAFGQSNAFGGNLFSSTSSIPSTSSMGFNQTTPSLSMPFQSAQPTQNSGGFRFAAPAGNHSENGIQSVTEIEALMPKLHDQGYYTEPRIQELAEKERVEPGSCRRVKDFVVGRHGCGSIKFLGETDVRHLDLKSIIHFSHLAVTVYMDDTQMPPVGEGLNKPAEVTLLNVRLFDEQTGRLLTEGPKIEKYIETLKKIAEDQGGESVSYDPIKGEWKFRVNHFSR